MDRVTGEVFEQKEKEGDADIKKRISYGTETGEKKGRLGRKRGGKVRVGL